MNQKVSYQIKFMSIYFIVISFALCLLHIYGTCKFFADVFIDGYFIRYIQDDAASFVTRFLIPPLICVLLVILAIMIAKDRKKGIFVMEILLFLFIVVLAAFAVANNIKFAREIEPEFMDYAEIVFMPIVCSVMALSIILKRNKKVLAPVIIFLILTIVSGIMILKSAINDYHEYNTGVSIFEELMQYSVIFGFCAICISLFLYNMGANKDIVKPVGNDNINISLSITAVILSIGVYYIFWAYRICKKVRDLTGGNKNIAGEFLCFIFLPLYAAYWFYTRNEELRKHCNIDSNKSSMYLIITMFGYGIVAMALFQTEINNINNTTVFRLKKGQ